MVEMKEEVVEKQSEAKAWAVATRIKSKGDKLGNYTAGAAALLKSDTPDSEETPGEFSSPMFETEETNGQG